MKNIDIVVPCYNEEEGLEVFINETAKITNEIIGYNFTFILVNDGSGDHTYLVMKKLAEKRSDIKYISFSRNFGKEAAMYAGLKYTTGDYVIVMDADLQHPPSLIPKMIKGIEGGHDCCAAMRSTRDGESKIRSAFSRTFYKVSNKITDVKMPYGAVDFRIMSRQMIDSILELSEVQRFSKGIFCWVGFDTKWIPYENIERSIGTTKWSFWGLFKYAIDGLTAFSVAPLRLIAGIGIFISLFAFIYILITLIHTAITGIEVPGYTTNLCATLFLGGITVFSIGVLGEYIGRIYMETKNRPIFILKHTNIDVKKFEENKQEKSEFEHPISLDENEKSYDIEYFE